MTKDEFDTKVHKALQQMPELPELDEWLAEIEHYLDLVMDLKVMIVFSHGEHTVDFTFATAEGN